MPGTQAGMHANGPRVPFRLDLEQQRQRAKELQRALEAGDAASWRRFRAHQTRSESEDRHVIRPSETERVIARELGLPSWRKLSVHIEAMERARETIAGAGEVLDAEYPTLHVRCGSDIRDNLAAAGFAGDFLEYSDPFCHGPVIDAPDWLQRRADFLARTYGAWINRGPEEIAASLEQAENDLRSAADRYERVVLWFEHDSYDQLILARCLAQFAERSPPRVELISIDRFPGETRFIGLGQLPPEALRLVWETRKPLSARQLSLGRAAWAALRAPDPSGLVVIARSGAPALPHLASAIARHCQELPWVGDGLSLMQRLILQMLAEEPHRIGHLFQRLMLEREPLPWQTDLLTRDVIEAMKQVSEPVFTGIVDEPESDWWRERLTITPLGRSVLGGEVDWLSLQPSERWVGGVVIRPGQPCWRWDGPGGSVLLCPSG